MCLFYSESCDVNKSVLLNFTSTNMDTCFSCFMGQCVIQIPVHSAADDHDLT